MAESLEVQRAALNDWLIAARPALERKEWRSAFAGYPRADLRDLPVPWAPAPIDVRSTRFTLVGSAGLSLPWQSPFDTASLGGDPTWRPVSVDTALDATTITHEHYPHAAAEQDRNTVFPLERLRALASAGEIGGLTEIHFSFMGYQPDWAMVTDSFAPQLATSIARERPDAVLLVPV
jgi:D-proline reductase (dithiol) PrdB